MNSFHVSTGIGVRQLRLWDPRVCEAIKHPQRYQPILPDVGLVGPLIPTEYIFFSASALRTTDGWVRLPCHLDTGLLSRVCRSSVILYFALYRSSFITCFRLSPFSNIIDTGLLVSFLSSRSLTNQGEVHPED